MALLKSAKEIKLIRAASKIVFETIKDLTNYLRPGLTTGQINERANAVIVEQGARPAFLGYQGFPAAVCVSINDEVVARNTRATPVKNRRYSCCVCKI